MTAPLAVRTEEDAGKGETVVAAPTRIEDMEEELVHEQAQVVVEELLKLRACTSLALAKALGFAKSTDVNPLLSLLHEKDVLAKVADFPPVWTISPTFPLGLAQSSATPSVVLGVPEPQTPHSSHGYPTPIQSCEPVYQPKPAQTTHSSPKPATITFPHIPAELTTRPIITFPPIPSETETATFQSVAVPAVPQQQKPLHHPQKLPHPQQQQQQRSTEYWESLAQLSSGRNNGNGGRPPPHKKWKRQKNLTGLQVRLLKELKERGPTQTLKLSKIVGLVTCRDVNPSIYDLKRRNMVVKVSNSPPVWQLKEPGVQPTFQLPAEDKDYVEDREDDDEDEFSDMDIPPPIASGGQLNAFQFYN